MPLDGRSPGRSLWVATIPSTVNTAQNIRDFALWYSRFSVDCLLAAPMVVGTAFLMLKCISSYLDCQYDSLSIDKCSKIGHRGPRCEEMLTNEEFIMKKKNLCPQWWLHLTPHYYKEKQQLINHAFIIYVQIPWNATWQNYYCSCWMYYRIW